ncbi:hypothetical protein Sjap_013066 [Stephania japonica]|uniref:Uncharacterized protein n=1 Tax=Stephania japonica TaxID=461633 RepID=A0AAP0IXB6_9MAGN
MLSALVCLRAEPLVAMPRVRAMLHRGPLPWDLQPVTPTTAVLCLQSEPSNVRLDYGESQVGTSFEEPVVQGRPSSRIYSLPSVAGSVCPLPWVVPRLSELQASPSCPRTDARVLPILAPS